MNELSTVAIIVGLIWAMLWYVSLAHAGTYLARRLGLSKGGYFIAFLLAANMALFGAYLIVMSLQTLLPN